MPVNLSIKNAPDDIVERLRERAAKHHRSLQGELLAIIEDAVRPPARLTARDVLVEVRRLALKTPAEAAAIIRADRDDRYGRRCLRVGRVAVRRAGSREGRQPTREKQARRPCLVGL